MDGPGQTIALVNVATGVMRPVSERRWPFVTARSGYRGAASCSLCTGKTARGTQLWRVDARTGAATAITRDLFTYTDFGVTADGETIVGTATLGEATLWTAEADRLGDPSKRRRAR